MKQLFTVSVAILLTAAPAARLLAQPEPCQPEPDICQAKLWWPDERNVWTTIGPKDHFFKFNVLYNGAVIFEPLSDISFRPQAEPFKGQGFQATFTPWPNTNTPALPDQESMLWKLDGGHGLQGWRTNCDAPVLWTDYPCQEGIVFRVETFSHVPGGAVKTGMDPAYAWMRVSVIHVDPLHAVKQFPMIVQLSRNYYAAVGRYLNENGVTIDVVPDRAPYPRKLVADSFDENGQTGLRIVEPDGKVRFEVLPTAPHKVQFYERAKGIYELKLNMQAKVGDYVDLLMPMFPEPQQKVDAETAVTYDGAMAQNEAFWKPIMDSGTAHFHVPEHYINQMVRHTAQLALLNSQKDPETGDYAFCTGPWGYDELWCTPVSMVSHMFLSLLGYEKAVDHYSEIYRRYQGQEKPPGATFVDTKGYFGAPPHFRAIDWLSDHGAVMLQVSQEALLSNDPKFIAEWTEPIVKACEFIEDACAQTNHDGVQGLLPPAVATDAGIPTQAVWNLAWNYKGLTTAVQFLKRIHHPRAAEFEALAERYKRTFVKAYREVSASAPTWRDASGHEYPVPPTTLSKTPMAYSVLSDAFYLDTGPMVLVWAGLMQADDPLMQATVKFFREGPDWALKGPRFNPICRPVLIREISSCEPCYSWNVYYSWQLDDRARYLEGMYSLFTAEISQQTFSGSEHRDGMCGVLGPNALAFDLARLAVIDDEIEPGKLHLLRMCPLAWVSSKEETTLDDMPTVYGPVTLDFKLSPDGKTLNVKFSGRWWQKPEQVILHVPPVPNLEQVIVNGTTYPAKGQILLPQ